MEAKVEEEGDFRGLKTLDSSDGPSTQQLADSFQAQGDKLAEAIGGPIGGLMAIGGPIGGLMDSQAGRKSSFGPELLTNKTGSVALVDLYVALALLEPPVYAKYQSKLLFSFMEVSPMNSMKET
ncbi:hypothetical protein CK203_077569 [Vitis vinifera]|uniref:Uncharacterized protein n=1 Tax=Vitis vinifera TaxID=29760 RepID=A0A438ETV3_VITVI|nr:hypothetical protein CK203_077569 [Vitis vinifera]